MSGSVLQSGPVTPGHLTVWDGNGIVIDGGPVPGGGAFLPLTGGTITGPFAVVGTQVDSGNFTAFGKFTGAISGARTTGDAAVSVITTTSDTLDAGAAGLAGQWITFNSGGGTTSGNRVGQYILTQFTGTTTDRGRGYNSQYAGQWVYSYISGNAGGTSLGDVWGNQWGGVISAQLQSGATYYNSQVGLEVDFGVAAGASAAYLQGLKVVAINNQQAPSVTGYFLGFAKAYLSDQGLMKGISFGSNDGFWPMDATTGVMIGTSGSNQDPSEPMLANYGIDFSPITFSTAFLKSAGFLVTGTGHTTLGAGISFGNLVGSSPADFSKHIDLYAGVAGINITAAGNSTNYVSLNSGSHTFYIGSPPVSAGYINTTGLNMPVGQQATYPGSFTLVVGNSFQTGGAGGPTWISGAGDPAGIVQPNSSLYSRTGGTTGSRLYVSAGGGTWNAVAGV